MDPREMETLIQRLVANPHDEEALAYAHRAGTQDPRSYAILLEKVGGATTDPAYAAHWLSEAANVWSTTIGDAHHAARTLMGAIEKDPTQRTAGERLAQLYRDKGDQKALVALLEKLVKSLTPLMADRPEVRAQLMAMHEELGRLWSEPPFGRPERAVENWRRLAELDPQNAYAIYAAREMLKAQQQFAEAIPFFAMEQAIVDDPERKLALFRDEAETRKRVGDLPGATQALRGARGLRGDDAALKQELGVIILERIAGGEAVPESDRQEAAALFISLAEVYDGEYGLSYSVSALKALPGSDRAMQLADYYGGKLNRTAELAPRYAAYVQANPTGFMVADARVKAGSAMPPPAPSMPNMPSGAPTAGVSRPSFNAPVAPAAAASFQQAQGPAPTFGQPPQSGASPSFPPGPGGTPSRPSFSAPVAPATAAAFQTPSQSPPAPTGPGTTPVAPPVVGAAPSPAAPVSAGASIEAPLTAGTQGNLQQLLEEAQAESQKGRKPQALTKFREALKLDPANSEALSWVEDHLRQKRMYADLRDVLLAASRVPSVSPDTRKAQLRDVAGLCESQLRDLETAIQAWKQVCQIDRGDEQAREQLRRLLEKGARWDDLASLLEQEAMGTPDVEQKIALEKKLATLHEQKRKDPSAAAEAWSRIANLSPEDESAIQTAVKLYEKAERFDLAAQVIADTVGAITEKGVRSNLLQKLGELRQKTGDAGGAGDAYAEAAEAAGQAKIWELAEKAFLSANRHADAANALEQRAQLSEGKQQATLLAQAADLLLKAGDTAGAIGRLERATELDPASDSYAQALEEQYRKEGQEPDLVRFLLARADKLNDKGRRISARRSAADIQRTLGDREGARESLLLLLSDGDDADALGKLIEDAGERGDYQEQVELLRRLGALTKDPAEKLAIALREAKVLAESLDDVEGAIERYEGIYKNIDPKSRTALGAIADLEEKRNNLQGTAAALEREVPLAEGEDRVALAQRLAQLYEGPLNNVRGAIKALEIIHAADPEDFDAIARLQKLSEEVEDWPRVAGLMQTLIEVEGDEEEASRLTRRLAEILETRLNKGDEALSALERLADQGDQPCRDSYVALGDKLGWKGIVATKLVAWNESVSGPDRNEALRSAFDRFLEIGRDADAARVAMELTRSRGADRSLAEKLEQLATKLKDLDALGIAHDILAKELSGTARAAELVRQAEVLVQAGVDPLEAMQHGEAALASVPPAEVEPLLARLAGLTQAPGHVIDLYERQVGRCRVPADRLVALARAAQVAAERGANDRARSFFELALGGGVQEDTIASLEGAARIGDEKAGGTALRAILADALAAGGQGSRDGGRTRGALLRRAATIAHADLHDINKAFGWLGDALITHVDDASLEALEQLGREVNDIQRIEATLSRALEEVFDGPLVRKLLHRRAKLRRDVLSDRKGAAVDLKKLHDLSPSDLEVMNDLSSLLLELGDHRGMIQLYEDQILRGRDPAQRAELARKVARIWEEDLGDARETADAWRRVLRMKAADPEATQGLERAKTGKLKRATPGAAAAEPAKVVSTPAAAAPRQAPTPLPTSTRSSSPPQSIKPPEPVKAPEPAKVETAPEEDVENTADGPPRGFSHPDITPEPAPAAAEPPAPAVLEAPAPAHVEPAAEVAPPAEPPARSAEPVAPAQQAQPTYDAQGNPQLAEYDADFARQQAEYEAAHAEYLRQQEEYNRQHAEYLRQQEEYARAHPEYAAQLAQAGYDPAAYAAQQAGYAYDPAAQAAHAPPAAPGEPVNEIDDAELLEPEDDGAPHH
jgi:tetratricopeptide (TPR) repeat protein